MPSLALSPSRADVSASPLSVLAQDTLAAGDLALRVLHTPEERLAIAALRKLSASAVEDDLGFALGPFETVRDQIGLVAALEREGQAIATIRFVPSGHGMTGLERLHPGTALPPGIVTPHSWEVGRLIVAPEERRPELLGQCFALALEALARSHRVDRFYAIATPLMARLWRRFGMATAAAVHGASGTEYKVVSGRALDVARALGVAGDALAPHAVAAPAPQAASALLH